MSEFLFALVGLVWVCCGIAEVVAYIGLSERYVDTIARFRTRELLPSSALPPPGQTELGELIQTFDGKVLRVRRKHGLVRRLPVVTRVIYQRDDSVWTRDARWGTGPVTLLVFPFLALVGAAAVGAPLLYLLVVLLGSAAVSAGMLLVFALVARGVAETLVAQLEDQGVPES